MINVNKVITDYSNETDDSLAVLGNSVFLALNPNDNFIWKDEVMPEFNNRITEYRLWLDKVLNGTSADVLRKNLAKAALKEYLRIIGREVNYQAGGDLIKLQSSGLRLAKIRTKVGVLPKPTNFAVESGDNSGDFYFSVDANPNANVYQFFSAMVPSPANTNEWRITSSSTRKRNASGFIVGKQYEHKAAYQGSDSTLVYSDSIFIYAQ